jgi:hypothetical protein
MNIRDTRAIYNYYATSVAAHKLADASMALLRSNKISDVGYNKWYQRESTSEYWGAASVANTGATDQSESQFVTMADGRAAQISAVIDGNKQRRGIILKYWDNFTGAPTWSIDVEAANGATGYGQPTVMIAPDGNVWIAYVDGDAIPDDPNDAYLRIYDADGNVELGKTKINSATSNGNNPQIAFDGNGRGWILYRAFGNAAVLIKGYNADGSVYSAEDELFENENEAEEPFTILVDGNDRIWVVGYTTAAAGGGWSAVYTILNNDGSTYKAVTEISDTVDGDCGGAAGAIGSDGKVYICFLQTIDLLDTIRYSKFDLDGTALFEKVQITPPISGGWIIPTWQSTDLNPDNPTFILRLLDQGYQGIVELELDQTLGGDYVFTKIGIFY